MQAISEKIFSRREWCSGRQDRKRRKTEIGRADRDAHKPNSTKRLNLFSFLPTFILYELTTSFNKTKSVQNFQKLNISKHNLLCIHIWAKVWCIFRLSFIAYFERITRLILTPIRLNICTIQYCLMKNSRNYKNHIKWWEQMEIWESSKWMKCDTLWTKKRFMLT